MSFQNPLIIGKKAKSWVMSGKNGLGYVKGKLMNHAKRYLTYRAKTTIIYGLSSLLTKRLCRLNIILACRTFVCLIKHEGLTHE